MQRQRTVELVPVTNEDELVGHHVGVGDGGRPPVEVVKFGKSADGLHRNVKLLLQGRRPGFLEQKVRHRTPRGVLERPGRSAVSIDVENATATRALLKKLAHPTCLS